MRSTPKTSRQAEACRLRRSFGWSLKRIARRLGVTESAVCQLLARADLAAGIPRRPPRGGRPCPRRRLIRTVPLPTHGGV